MQKEAVVYREFSQLACVHLILEFTSFWRFLGFFSPGKHREEVVSNISKSLLIILNTQAKLVADKSIPDIHINGILVEYRLYYKYKYYLAQQE